jgi:hypothetical protein
MAKLSKVLQSKLVDKLGMVHKPDVSTCCSADETLEVMHAQGTLSGQYNHMHLHGSGGQGVHSKKVEGKQCHIFGKTREDRHGRPSLISTNQPDVICLQGTGKGGEQSPG